MSNSLECACGAIVENVGPKCVSVTCWRCTAKGVAPPDLKPVQKKKASTEKRHRVTEDDKMEDAINSALNNKLKKKNMKNSDNSLSDMIENSNGNMENSPADNANSSEAPVKRKRGRPKGALKGTAQPKPHAGFGRGWHLKKLFEHEGKFYSFGQEVTAAQADKLR